MKNLPIEYKVWVLSTKEHRIEHLLYKAIVGSICKLETPSIEEKVFKLDWQAQSDLLGRQFNLHLRDHLVHLLLR